MNFVKQYIIQCITVAANNLRLSSEKIEAVTILREFLREKDDFSFTIAEMKKVTELSKFAIKLSDVHKFISASKIDFLRLSDNFKNHSHLLVKELSHLLEQNSPNNLKKLLYERIDNNDIKNTSLKIDNNKNEVRTDDSKKDLETKEVSNEEKEKIKLKVVDEIRDAANLINEIESGEYSANEIDKHIAILKEAIITTEKVGLDRLTKMLSIFTNSISEIKSLELKCDLQTLEGMRACLIVAAAIARNKNVDVTDYQLKAEKFGKRFFSKSEEGNE